MTEEQPLPVPQLPSCLEEEDGTASNEMTMITEMGFTNDPDDESSDEIDADDNEQEESHFHDPDLNRDVLLLVASTRKLLKSDPQISQSSSNSSQSDMTYTHSGNAKDKIASRISLDPSYFSTEQHEESFVQTMKRSPISLQNLSTDSDRKDIHTCEDISTSVAELPANDSTEISPIIDRINTETVVSADVIEPITIEHKSPDHPFNSDVRNEKVRSNNVHQSSSHTTVPIILSESPRMAPSHSFSVGGSRRGIKAIPTFFRQKPSLSAPCKTVQLKELKRMIRAGKPSYEQINKWRNSFETLLNDRFGLALFKEFLSTEFSDENIEFWIACQEYKQITNPKKMALRAQRIFDEFIAVQANREVNLDSTTRLQTEADLVNPSIHTLDNAQKRIQALMEKDSYRRFLRSEVYLTLYTEARQVAKASAATALAASLQEASGELEGAVRNLITSSSSASPSPFSFFSQLGTQIGSASSKSGFSLPGVAAAAANAEAGMNNIQDLQLLGLATSRHMQTNRSQSRTNPNNKHPSSRISARTNPDTHSHINPSGSMGKINK